FFFQAEDGIRDLYVTGVQTCALPICWRCGAGTVAIGPPPSRLSVPTGSSSQAEPRAFMPPAIARASSPAPQKVSTRLGPLIAPRSEERRVGKGWRCRWWADQERKERR